MSNLPSVDDCGVRCKCELVALGLGTRCLRYRAELESEIARRTSAHESGVDVWRELAKIGAPADAVSGCRRGWDTKALQAAKRFESAKRELLRTLVLAGPRGCGKTVAAVHVLWEWARGHDWNSQPGGGKQWRPAIWCNASELTGQTEFGRVDPQWLETLRHARVLVIDDLGEDGTPAGLTALTDILKSRHEARKATVITTNLASVDLERRYGQSWLERLKAASLVPDLREAKSLRKKPNEARP